MTQLFKRIVFVAGIALFCTCGLFAQSLEQAKRLYTAGKYDLAKPMFEKLAKQSPKNASYNHWYGVCCFETDDPVTAEPYLKIAASRRVQESYRYLGELYINAYRFDEAVEMYTEYIDILSKKNEDIEPYRKRLEVAGKAQRMVDKVENIRVIDSVVVDKNDFLTAYTLSEEAGRIVSYRDFFRTVEPVSSSVYMNEIGDKIYYAHPEGGQNNYNLFTQSRLLDKWSDEKRLPSNINNDGANNNYPFILTDGVTIYYASEGNGSIGGYDLFVTRYNINSDAYLTPEQLGMPFNSLANDYMMVVDEKKGLGWFVSDRNQTDNKVCVYLFIPDEQRSRIDSDDPGLKRSRALITSIADTWEAAAGYTDLVSLAHEDIPSGKEAHRDFEFVINNNLIYYTWDDFKSPQARDFYERRISIGEQIEESGKRLDALRNTYSRGNNVQKEHLKPTILQMEEQLYRLLLQPPSLEKRARNAEINHLKINN
ncbi:MAG: tetratricopeptide repeat protein [Tannerellaceae bacterium]|jgi:tetratricopeptide (TPR) repeat protein|nr:tetratricopeptide repeat protein [Tannerellaceae bacterium]